MIAQGRARRAGRRLRRPERPHRLAHLQPLRRPVAGRRAASRSRTGTARSSAPATARSRTLDAHDAVDPRRGRHAGRRHRRSASPTRAATPASSTASRCRTHGAYDPAAAMRLALEHQNPLVAARVTGGAAAPLPADARGRCSRCPRPTCCCGRSSRPRRGSPRGLIARVWNLADAPRTMTLALPGARDRRRRSRATHIETDLGPATLVGGRGDRRRSPRQQIATLPAGDQRDPARPVAAGRSPRPLQPLARYSTTTPRAVRIVAPWRRQRDAAVQSRPSSRSSPSRIVSGWADSPGCRDRPGSLRNAAGPRGYRERSAADRAGAHRDHEPGIGDRLVGLLQRRPHVRVDHPGDHDSVGVPRRGHELDAESCQVEDHVAERDQLGLAAAATAGRRPSAAAASGRTDRASADRALVALGLAGWRPQSRARALARRIAAEPDRTLGTGLASSGRTGTRRDPAIALPGAWPARLRAFAPQLRADQRAPASDRRRWRGSASGAAETAGAQARAMRAPVISGGRAPPGSRRPRLQVMAGIGQVEALVAEWKIGDRVAAHHLRQRAPVVERRILDLPAPHAAAIVRDHNVHDFSTPSFDIATAISAGASAAAAGAKLPARQAASCSIRNSRERSTSSRRTIARAATSPAQPWRSGM